MSDEQKPTLNQTPEDLFQTLMVQAAESAAKREAQDALEKGFVTRKDINLALTAFGDQLEQKIVESVKAALLPTVEEAVQKAAPAGQRKSTIATPEEEREADPVAYILKKGREVGPEGYDDIDKRIIWGLTFESLKRGMEFDPREEE